MIVVWGIAVLCTLFLSSCKRPEVLDNSTLVNSARNVALTFGPAYVPYFNGAIISDVQVFKKEDYGDCFLMVVQGTIPPCECLITGAST